MTLSLCLTILLRCGSDSVLFLSLSSFLVDHVFECILKEPEEVKKPAAPPSLPAEKPGVPKKGTSHCYFYCFKSYQVPSVAAYLCSVLRSFLPLIVCLVFILFSLKSSSLRSVIVFHYQLFLVSLFIGLSLC